MSVTIYWWQMATTPNPIKVATTSHLKESK